MPKNRRIQKGQTETTKRLMRLCYLAIAISLVAIVLSSYSLMQKAEDPVPFIYTVL